MKPIGQIEDALQSLMRLVDSRDEIATATHDSPQERLRAGLRDAIAQEASDYIEALEWVLEIEVDPETQNPLSRLLGQLNPDYGES